MKVSQAYNCRKAGYAPDVRSVSCLNVEKYFDYLKQMHYANALKDGTVRTQNARYSKVNGMAMSNDSLPSRP